MAAYLGAKHPWLPVSRRARAGPGPAPHVPCRPCRAAPQVYASYKYRRDFAETAKAGGRLLELLRPLPREAARRGAVEGPAGGQLTLDAPSMRQAIAWELALHAIHGREVGGRGASWACRPGLESGGPDLVL